MFRLFEDPGVELFHGLNLSALSIDQAYLVLHSNVDITSWLYGRSDDCYQVGTCCEFFLRITDVSCSIIRRFNVKLRP